MKTRYCFVVVIVILSACSGEPGDTANLSASEKVETSLGPPYKFDVRARKTFDIMQRMAFYRVPAVSITVINNGKIEWSKAYGYLNSDGFEKADSTTLFQAGSATQLVTALTVLQLVDQGKIHLTDDIRERLNDLAPEHQAKSVVTLAQLLSHTSGVVKESVVSYQKDDHLPALSDIIRASTFSKDTIPGSVCEYNPRGYTFAQKVLEDVSGKNLEAFAAEAIFKPMQMNHSTYAQHLQNSFITLASTGHHEREERVKGNWNLFSENGATGLWTTSSDLAKVIIEIQKSLKGESRLLSAETSAQMLHKQADCGFGLGPMIEDNEDPKLKGFSMVSQINGYCTFLFGFNELGRGAVIMTNSDRSGRLVEEIRRAIADVYDWNKYETQLKVPVKLKHEVLKQFTGTYIFKEDPTYKVYISVEDDHLLVEQSWDGEEVLLFPETNKQFFSEQGPIVFNFNQDQSVQSLYAYDYFRFIKEVDEE